MRFFKIFLVSFGSLVATVGIALGVMFLAGSFNEEVIMPESIAFEQSVYDAAKDFEMTITTPTENVTEKTVTLSFASDYTEVEGYITDGVITVPKLVKIGTPFKVVLNKENKLIGEERIAWIKGGVSTLRATSENVTARTETAKVYVDVPVHSIELVAAPTASSPSQNVFNIGSNFVVKANFFPQESEYQFSKNGSDGNPAVYKTVFFSTLSKSLALGQKINHNTQAFTALEQASDVLINGQVFASVEDELNILKQVETFETEELKRSYILSALDSLIGDKKAENSVSVEFVELKVGSYTVGQVNVPSKFNQAIQLFANKATTSANQFNLQISVLASDNNKLLPEHIANIGIAVALESSSGYVDATQGQFLLDSRKTLVQEFYGQDFTFHFPFTHQTDINQSYWNLYALGENMTAKLFVVLFEQTEDGLGPHEFSLQNGNPKFILDIDPTTAVSNRIYWSDANNTTTTLYVYENIDPSQTIYQQFDLKNLAYIIPAENSYKTVLYFAYIERECGSMANDEFVGKYIVVGDNKAKYIRSAEDYVDFYEIPNGVITPKGTNELPNGWMIKVVMATVKTNFDGSFVFDEQGYYVVDRFSSANEQGALQTLNFEVAKTLKTIDAHLRFDAEIAVQNQSTLAVVHGQVGAFELVFDIAQDQQNIFERDWNNGRITFVFKINGQVEQSLFSYDQVEFESNPQGGSLQFSVPVNVDYIKYTTNDPGYRNFTVEVLYRRGYEQPVATLLNNAEFVDEDQTSTLINDAIFEVYDGKIATLTFADDYLHNVTSQNPIFVKTSLTEDQEVHREEGIAYASVESTSSFTHNGEVFEKSKLYEENSNNIAVVAFDKYGKEIKDKSLWRLVSSDTTGKVLAVDASGQSLSFLGTSTSPVMVSIVSEHGIGGKTVNSTYGIYFDVETLGKILYVGYNSTEDIAGEKSIFKNYNENDYNETDRAFGLLNPNLNYEPSQIQIALVGRKDRTVYLSHANQVNLFKVYYGLPTEQDKYKLFDLLKITKYVREEGDFEGIQFHYNDEQTSITGFTIKKDFGQSAYLDLKAETDIGIVIDLRLEILPNISVKVGKFGHEEEGAQYNYKDSIRYTGVFARHKIEITFDFEKEEGQDLNIAAQYTALLYDAATRTIVALENVNMGQNRITATSNKVVVTFYLPDVASITFVDYVFVLDSRTSIDTYENYTKTMYDYSRTLYLCLNPNATAALNSENPDITVEGSTATISVATSNDIITLVGIGNEFTNTLIVADRIVGTVPLTLSKTSNNYVVAAIVNQAGELATNQYFYIEDNKLHLSKPFENTQTLYIALLHYVSATQYFKVRTFTITIIPDIVEDQDHKDNFVVYNGIKYLQLEAGVEYYFALASGEDEDIVSNFTVSKPGVQFNLNVSFDNQYQVSTTYWQISGNKIYIKDTTQIIADRLWVNVEIMGVAKINYPVIIMPRKAPFVFYDTVPNTLTTEDPTLVERNMQANSDLANLLSIDYLVANNIYDAVQDGLVLADNYSVFASESKANGLYLTAGNVIFTMLNGQGGHEGTEVASVNSQGILTTNFVGEDTYIIIQATVDGLSMFYRLKIVSSLSLKTFYPYDDNSQESGKAEYVLFRPTDTTKTITFSANFTSEIPASNFEINNVVERVFDEDTNSYIYKPVKTFATKRLMMFRNVMTESGPAKIKMDYAIESVWVSKIEIGLMTDLTRQSVSPNNYSTYVLTQHNETIGTVDVLLKNAGSYVVTLAIKTTSNAVAYYTIAVEQTSRVYQIVQKLDDEPISEMQSLPDDYAITINSPEYGQDANQSTALQNKYLRLGTGVSFQDRTDILKYHIVNNVDNLLHIEKVGDEVVILAEYSVNSVYASLLFYTKYGQVKTIPLTLQSLTKVHYDKQVFANNVIDLQNHISFTQTENGVDVNVDATWKSVQFVGQKPLFVDRIGQSFKFVLLPIKQNTTEQVELLVTVEITGQEYQFICSLTINSSLESNTPSSLNITPIPQNYFALGDVELDVFNGEYSFFTNNSADIELSSQNNLIYGIISGLAEGEYAHKYTLNVTAISGANAVDTSRVIRNGKLVIKTKAVAEPTQVVLAADLIFTKNTDEGLYEFILTSYLSFTVFPDTSVELFYPAPNGTQLEFESVFYTDASIKFDANAAFQTPSNKRVVITALDGEENLSNKQIYVTYSIVGGDPDLIVTGGVLLSGETDKYDFFNSTFMFDFADNSAFTFANIDFEIFVSGISRAIYTVRVYKNISSVYGIVVNNINTTDGRNEVFYLGEDRPDIFNGVQAFQYTINSALSNTHTIRLFKNNAGSMVNLGKQFVVSSSERGLTKTDKINAYSELMSDLTLENIRFTVDGSSNYLTLAQMAPYFAIGGDGLPRFKVIRRIEVTYLGMPVYDTEFLSKIQIREPAVEENSSGFSTFTVSYEGLGDTVESRLDNLVEVFVGSATAENTLGVYYYSVKVNLVVAKQKETINIMVGEEKTKMLEVLGVTKQDGTPFIMPASGTVDPLIVNKKLELSLDFKRLSEDSPLLEFVYADDKTTIYTEHFAAAVQPLQYSVNRGFNSELNEYYNYDFTMLASGAPNAGIIGTILFKYVYHDSYSSEQYEFVKHIKVQVNPNWQITLTNGTGGENSEITPEIITYDYFGSSDEYNDILVDALNPMFTKITAYRINNYELGNRAAYDFTYTIIQPENPTGIAEVIGTTVKLYKSAFAERKIQVKMEDVYGYEATYYYVVLPEHVITFSQITGKNVFEGDNLILQYEGFQQSETDNIDHVVVLSTNVPHNTYVTYTLRRAEDGRDLGAIIHQSKPTASQTFSINFIDGELFSSVSKSLLVYLEVHLQQDLGNGLKGEVYTVKSGNFFLFQRYGAVVGNVHVRDGQETNLINHVQIYDYREASNLGTPTLEKEKTLVINKQNFEGEVTILASKGSVSTSKEIVINVSGSNQDYRYFMIGELSDGAIEDINNYTYTICSINEKNGIRLSVSGNDLLLENTDDAYVVHLFKNGEYRDEIVTGGEPIDLGSAGWSILGYEKDTSGIGVKVETADGKQSVNISRTSNVGFEITLLNRGTINSNVRQLTIRQSTQSPYNTVTITNNLGAAVQNVSITAGVIELQGGGYDYTGAGEDWYISEIKYTLGNYKPYKFLIRDDKKLNIVTVVKMLSGPTEENPDAPITYQKVNVNFNGTNRYIEVELNQSGKQVFSILERFGLGSSPNESINDYALSSTQPIKAEELVSIKGMTYYNDTLELTFEAADRMVNMNFKLTRVRNGVAQNKTFSVTLKTYKFTHAVGLSQIFDSMIEPGDVYTLTVENVPTVNLNGLEVKWPDYIKTNTKFDVASDFVGTEQYGSYTVKDFDNSDIEIEGGIAKIQLDSLLQYNNDAVNKLVGVTKYYIIKFKDAFYVLDPIQFKVSPYFYGIDTSQVYSTEGGVGQRVITDYEQRTSGGKVSYVINFSTWASKINFVDSSGNLLKDEYNLIQAKNRIDQQTGQPAPLVQFSLEDGGSGAGQLEPNGDLITENIQPGLTYFTINIKVALNGVYVGEDTQWLQIGTLLLGLDSNPQYFLQPKNAQGNKIGYTIMIDQPDELLARYIEIEGDNPITFSTNSLFDGENVQSYNTTHTTVSNLTSVFLTQKQERAYRVEYPISATTSAHVIVNSTFINANQNPVITAVNIRQGNSVILTATKGTVSYVGTYVHNSSTTLYGTIRLSEIKTKDEQNNPITFDQLPGGIETYTITTTTPNVGVMWTKLDLTAIKPLVNANFFGDGTSNAYIDGLIANVHASKVFRISLLESNYAYGNNVEKVNVIVGDRGNLDKKIEYYAITQINTNAQNVANYIQTHVYKVTNTTTLTKKETIKLLSWNNQVFGAGTGLDDYSPIVIVEKLTALNAFSGYSALGLDGYYSNAFGFLNSSDFDQKFAVIEKVSVPTVQKLNYKDEMIIDLFKDLGDIVTEQQSLNTLAIYTTLLESTGQDVAIDLTPEENHFANIIKKSQTTGGVVEYVYYYHTSHVESIKLPNNTKAIVLQQSNMYAGSLIWHEYMSKSKPLDVYYYALYVDDAWKPQQPVGEIASLKDGDIVGKIWNGAFTNTGGLGDNDYLQITYGQPNDEDYEIIYFRLGDHKNGLDIVVGNLLTEDDELMPLDVSRFGKVSVMTHNAGNFVSAPGFYTVAYDEQTYAVINYLNQEFSLFDLIANTVDGKNSITYIRKSLVEFTFKANTTSLGWTVGAVGIYAFSFDNMFKVVDLRQTTNYNLFAIFEKDVLLADKGDIKIEKIVEKLEVFRGTDNQGVTSVYVMVNNHQFNNVPVVPDDENDQYFVAVSLYDAPAEFWNNLTSTKVKFYQVDATGQEVLDNNPSIKRIINNTSNYSIVESTTTVKISDF